MKTILILWAIVMLICSHAFAYNMGALKACNNIEEGLKKAAKEIKKEMECEKQSQQS